MRELGKSWKYTRVLKDVGQRKFEKDILDGSGNIIKLYSHSGVSVSSISDVMKAEGISEEEVYHRYFEKIFRDTNAQSSIRTRVMDAAEDLGDFVSIDYIPQSGRSKGQLATVYYKGNNRDQIAWLKDVAFKRGGRLVKLEKTGTYWEGFPLNNLTKEGGVRFPNGKKPEALLKKILELSTNPGDLILDSFAGSGTTGAVAHKMNRRWIMVELGDHCHTHIIPRLQKVISGEDQGGISPTVEWKGGGGFRYYSVAPSLIEFDKYNQPVINKEYNPVMLTQAMCKLMGFTYAPSDTVYWQQGHSTETDYIYVTTQTLEHAQLAALSEEVGDDRSLLICCGAFRGNADQFENLTVRKIPRAVLDKCDWSKDDYSLNVENLPMLEQDNEPRTALKPAGSPRAAKAKKASAAAATGSLFGGDDADE
jgi:adenine-specific DNA-methyltransferase